MKKELLASYPPEEARATFSSDELKSSSRMYVRLARLWGDLLQDRSERVFRGLQERFSTVADLLPVLELLERHDLIRPVGEPPRPGPGRKPSPVYRIHPKAFGEDERP